MITYVNTFEEPRAADAHAEATSQWNGLVQGPIQHLWEEPKNAETRLHGNHGQTTPYEYNHFPRTCPVCACMRCKCCTGPSGAPASTGRLLDNNTAASQENTTDNQCEECDLTLSRFFQVPEEVNRRGSRRKRTPAQDQTDYEQLNIIE